MRQAVDRFYRLTCLGASGRVVARPTLRLFYASVVPKTSAPFPPVAVGVCSLPFTFTQTRGPRAETHLSDDDKATIDRFRRETVSIRRELRGVQRALRKDIDRLDAWLKFFNIAAIPLLLVAVTLVVAVIRRVRRRPDRESRPWAEA